MYADLAMENEALNAHLFGSLTEVREIVQDWMIGYNEERPYQSLGSLPPSVFQQQSQTRSGSELHLRTVSLTGNLTNALDVEDSTITITPHLRT